MKKTKKNWEKPEKKSWLDKDQNEDKKYSSFAISATAAGLKLCQPIKSIKKSTNQELSRLFQNFINWTTNSYLNLIQSKPTNLNLTYRYFLLKNYHHLIQ